jgi:hypothetical protein
MLSLQGQLPLRVRFRETSEHRATRREAADVRKQMSAHVRQSLHCNQSSGHVLFNASRGAVDAPTSSLLQLQIDRCAPMTNVQTT